MSALGQRFRAAREARGLAIAEVAEQIRIRAVYLAAIENEAWSEIGAPVYIRGFLRTYARFLGLDAEEAVAAFNLGEEERGAIVPARGDLADIERAGGRRGLQLSPLIWIASLVAVILIAFVVYNELTLPKPSPVAFSATASPQPPASPLPAAAAMPSLSPSALPNASPLPTGSALASAGPLASGAHVVTLRLTGLCWIEVVVDGAVASEGTFAAGTVKTFTGRNIDVRVGNAGAADLVLDGQDLGKMGAAGQVVERSFAS
jgi:cytoskeleton protein RodZ